MEVVKVSFLFLKKLAFHVHKLIKVQRFHDTVGAVIGYAVI